LTGHPIKVSLALQTETAFHDINIFYSSNSFRISVFILDFYDTPFWLSINSLGIRVFI